MRCAGRMPDPRLAPLVLSDDERRMLESWTRRRSTAQGLALRARTESVKRGGQAVCVVCDELAVSMVAGGSLIQTLSGRGLGCGQWPRNRSGRAWWAARMVAARRAWTCAQVPSCTEAGVCIAIPECRCSVL
jgi:hypothetical protein